jgi:endonuclease-3
MVVKKIDFLKDIKILKVLYPDAHCALNFSNPFELLVATILSAQCTDERVNRATPALFFNWPDPTKLSQASLSVVEKTLSSINFYRNKAKNLIGMAQMLVDKFKGQVPQKLDELILLPGVGRKTANVVLGNAFHQASGIVVDTHVARLAFRMGWTKFKDPVQIEKDLIKKIPPQDWILISHLLIYHGRSICKARRPDCQKCALKETCPKKGVTGLKLRSSI